MSAPTTKKKSPRAAKPAPAAPTSAPLPDVDGLLTEAGFPVIEGNAGVQLGKSGRQARELVPLFTTSKGRKFSMLVPSPMLCFEYMERLRAEGPDATTPWFLNVCMGEEARVALATDPDASEEDIARVYAIVTRTAFGAVKKFRELIEGKS